MVKADNSLIITRFPALILDEYKLLHTNNENKGSQMGHTKKIFEVLTRLESWDTLFSLAMLLQSRLGRDQSASYDF